MKTGNSPLRSGEGEHIKSSLIVGTCLGNQGLFRVEIGKRGSDGRSSTFDRRGAPEQRGGLGGKAAEGAKMEHLALGERAERIASAVGVWSHEGARRRGVVPSREL